MSDIKGEGFGSAHDWKFDITDRFDGEKGTRYLCRYCGSCFVHLYDVFPNIFEAMKLREVPELCAIECDEEGEK